MKFLVIVILFFHFGYAQQPSDNTTIIIVRHAEKESVDSDDPNLSHDGRNRAEALCIQLKDQNIDALYATPYKRTKQTLEPLAKDRNLKVQEYSTRVPYKDFLNAVITQYKGGVVVIAGHSNTVPGMLDTLSDGAFVTTIGEDQFDNIFFVTIADGQMPTIVQSKYGKPTQ